MDTSVAIHHMSLQRKKRSCGQRPTGNQIDARRKEGASKDRMGRGMYDEVWVEKQQDEGLSNTDTTTVRGE